MHRSDRWQQVLITTGCALAAGGLLGCQDPLAPPRLREPLLVTLQVDDFLSSFVDRGVLTITGQLAPEAPAFEEPDRLAIQLSLNTGDAEVVHLSRHFCYPGPRDCSSLSVGMRTGRTIAELDEVIRDVARWWNACPSQTCGGLRVFDPRRVDHLLATLEMHPATNAVSRDALRFGGDEPTDPSRFLVAAHPLDTGVPVPYDGVIQAAPGDTLLLTYAPASGPTVVVRFVMPIVGSP